MNKHSRIVATLVRIACLSHTGCVNETKDHPQKNQSVGSNYSTVNQQANYAEADTTLLQKAELTKIYTKAIAEFIRAANKKNETAFDTLYFAKRKNGQPDDFPDIELPGKIENTQIVLVAPEIAEKLQQELKTRVYINLMGWTDKEKAEFIFVVFSNGFDHVYDYSISYMLNTTNKELELEKIQFKGPPFD